MDAYKAALRELIDAASDPNVVKNYMHGVVGPTNKKVSDARERLKKAAANMRNMEE